MAYPGGKSGGGVYHRIINLMPPHRVYIEPFLGGAAVMRVKRPADMNIGLDLDAAVVAQALKHFHGTPPATAILEHSVCALPADDERSLAGGNGAGARAADPPARAGGGRSTFDLRACDGIEFLKSYKFRGDELVYCDPPYMRSLCNGPPRYRCSMDDRDHLELLKVLRGLVGRSAELGRAPCFVMISGYWCELYADMLSGWRSITFQAMTRGGLRWECLWFNFDPPTVLHDYRYLGADYRERERIKRKTSRWLVRLRAMPELERRALVSAVSSEFGGSILAS